MDKLFSVTDKDRELYNLYSRMNTNELLDLKRTDPIYRIAVFERVNSKGDVKSFAEMSISGFMPILSTFPTVEDGLAFIESFKPGFRYTPYFAEYVNNNIIVEETKDKTVYKLGKYKYVKSPNKEQWYMNKDLHNNYGPAVIEYNPKTGHKSKAIFYIRGDQYREDGPTFIIYNENGSTEEYYPNEQKVQIMKYKSNTQNGENYLYEMTYKTALADIVETMTGSPIPSSYYPPTSRYKGAKLDREDGPALIEYYSNGSIKKEHYYVDGKTHRTDGPAIIEYDNMGRIIKRSYYENDRFIK